MYWKSFACCSSYCSRHILFEGFVAPPTVGALRVSGMAREMVRRVCVFLVVASGIVTAALGLLLLCVTGSLRF